MLHLTHNFIMTSDLYSFISIVMLTDTIDFSDAAIATIGKHIGYKI